MDDNDIIDGTPTTVKAAKRIADAAQLQLLIQQWEVHDKNDPDCWLVVPEFGVLPQQVDYEGFLVALLIPEAPELTGPCRTIVRAARKTLRSFFATKLDFIAAYSSAWEKLRESSVPYVDAQLTELESAAIVYGKISDGVSRILTAKGNVQPEDLARTSELVILWMSEGAAAAVKKISERNRTNAQGPRVPVTAEQMYAFAIESGYPASITLETFLAAAAAKFHCSESTAGRRLKAAKDAGLFADKKETKSQEANGA